MKSSIIKPYYYNYWDLDIQQPRRRVVVAAAVVDDDAECLWITSIFVFYYQFYVNSS